MERITWSDERLGDLNARVESGFDLLLAEIRGLRGEFGDLRGEFAGLRDEFGGLRGEFGGLRGEMFALQRQIAQIGWTLAGGLITALVAAFTALIVALV